MSTDTPVTSAPADVPSPGHAVVPIRSIGKAHVDKIRAHLLALEPEDRYLRFGYLATDEQIGHYVDGLNFERDELFGIFNRQLDLIGTAHLAYSTDPSTLSCAEFGVSVAKKARGRGYGRRLFERAIMHARNDGISLLFIHALSENKAMLHIARTAGAMIERDGSESEAHLLLPPANLDSKVAEMITEQMGVTDYHLKAQANYFWQALAVLQEIRAGVKKAREQSNS